SRSPAARQSAGACVPCHDAEKGYRLSSQLWRRRAPSCAAALLTFLFAACRGDSESSIARGDRFWADSHYQGALAEYRLALRHRADDPAILLRVAHAYAETGQLQPARATYAKLLQHSGG